MSHLSLFGQLDTLKQHVKNRDISQWLILVKANSIRKHGTGRINVLLFQRPFRGIFFLVMSHY